MAQENQVLKNTTPVYTTLESLNQLKVYPNPATEQLNILLSDKDSTCYKLHIYNMQGQVIYKTRFNKSAAPSTLDINVSQLQQGTYIISLETTNNKRYRVKFVR